MRSGKEVRDTIESSGVSVSEWARANSFSVVLVYQVLAGKRKCLRGQSHRIAIALGMKVGRPCSVNELSDLLASGQRPEPGANSSEEDAM